MKQYDHIKRREYYRKNAERIKAYNRKWRKNLYRASEKHRQEELERIKSYHQTERGKLALSAGYMNTNARKRAMPGKVSVDDLLSIDQECAACGSNKNLEFDHIVSARDGGINERRNLQMLCVECHKMKTKNEQRARTLGIRDIPDIDPVEQLELF